MSNVARSEDVKEGKEAASQTASTILLQRHPPRTSKGDAGQDLQDLYNVPRRDVSSGIGAYWLKMAGGSKVQGDETLARVVHEAVLRKQITHHDYPLLKLFPGGLRLLQMIGHLLIESHAGTPVDQQKMEQSLTAWYRAFAECEARRSTERRRFWKNLESAQDATSSALQLLREFVRVPELNEFLETRGVTEQNCVWDVEVGAAEDPISRCTEILKARREALAVGLKRLAQAVVQERRSASLTDVAGMELQDPSVSASLETINTRESLLAKLRKVNNKVGTVLRAVNRLQREAKANRYIDLQCALKQHDHSKEDNAQGTGCDASSAHPLDLLREAIARIEKCLSQSRAEEKYSAGFADLPSIKPRGPDVAVSLDFMHQQLLDIVAIEWEDDPEGVEIVVEDLGDSFETLESESEPKPLVWVRRTEAVAGAQAQ